MRFAWLRQQAGNDGPVEQSAISQLIYVTYNIVYWVPIVLAFAKVIDYELGFITFTIVIAVRTALNWYRVNVLPEEKAQIFPFRAP